jgi:hypothetical protein
MKRQILVAAIAATALILGACEQAGTDAKQAGPRPQPR